MKRNEYDFSASCTSLEELLDAISKLPSNTKYLNVPTSLCHFQPPSVKIGCISEHKHVGNTLREVVENYLVDTLKGEKDWGVVTDFYLCSYRGGKKEGDAYYIRLSSKESTKFGNDMSSGKYGPLD